MTAYRSLDSATANCHVTIAFDSLRLGIRITVFICAARCGCLYHTTSNIELTVNLDALTTRTC